MLNIGEAIYTGNMTHEQACNVAQQILDNGAVLSIFWEDIEDLVTYSVESGCLYFGYCYDGRLTSLCEEEIEDGTFTHTVVKETE